MSAFIHHPEHIAAIVGSAHSEDYTEPHDMVFLLVLSELFQQKNAVSVGHRYSSKEEYEPVMADMIKRWLDAPLSPEQLHTALQSYAYQSCECPDWKRSMAHQFYSQLMKRVVPHLPVGRDGRVSEGCWSITAPPEVSNA